MGRFVAAGNPHSKFSCSEFHEVYEGVMELNEERNAARCALLHLQSRYEDGNAGHTPNCNCVYCIAEHGLNPQPKA